MKLKQARVTFTHLIPKLIEEIESLGAEAAISFVKRCEGCPVGTKNSNHKKSLAVDIDLYVHGVYQVSTKAHQPLGDFWEGLHPNCRWGGRFRDGNHYEFVQEGWR